jgi:transcriptional regulator with GAF, ATPase, and Fis domain
MTLRTGLTQAVVEAAPTPADVDRRPAVGDASVSFTFKPDPVARPGASDPVFVAAALAQLVETVTSSDSDRSAWQAITDVAATLIPGAEQAGVVVDGDVPPPEAYGAAVGDVRLLMKVEHDTGEGPCQDAARTGDQVLVHDLRSDARWPEFISRTPWQLHSMLCTPMPITARGVGVLTVVSARAWAFDENSARVATVVAAHAALALRLLEQLRNLRAMADSREIIGQATGILMQQHRLPAEQAFHVLAQASQERNVKLRTLAAQLTDTMTPADITPSQP